MLVAACASLIAASALAAQQATRTVCVIDAASGSTVPYARITWDGSSRTLGDACTMLNAREGTKLHIARLGYAPWHGNMSTDADTLFVHLAPIAAALPAATTRAASTRAAAREARNAVTLRVDSARAFGAHSTGSLVAMLPYTFPPERARRSVPVAARCATVNRSP